MVYSSFLVHFKKLYEVNGKFISLNYQVVTINQVHKYMFYQKTIYPKNYFQECKKQKIKIKLMI